ncbi:MAG: class I SAM-dependent RNA methyltransferase [Aristaeellaceae bacterium]
MDLSNLTMLATAAFGLEGVVASELKRLGMRDVKGEIGGARFTGSVQDAYLCNLRLRCADRVLIVLRERECRSFEELFQFVKSFEWEELLPADAKINVSGKCARSQLMSIRDCQAITKKAIIERLKEKTRRSVFPETCAAYPIEISLHSDLARLTLDTSGTALNRRGYRTWNGEAPLRETLAAALVELSTWRPGMRLHDPCCGTGTLLIEAAFRLSHRAPGLTRHFEMEQFSFFPAGDCAFLHKQCREDVDLSRVQGISGSDIDPEALNLAQRHVKQAGLSGRIELTNVPLQQLQLAGEPGVFLCNPPYGERLSDRKSCEKLYAEMGKLLKRHPGWSLCAITSDPMFERAFGRRADKKRRLYNGRLECEFLIYK